MDVVCFQYAILLTVVLTIFVKYVLHTLDLQSENPWESKAVYMLYTDLSLGMATHSNMSTASLVLSLHFAQA